jgi:hypothetical protein
MTDSEAASVPVYQEYMNPLLEALRGQGQALRIEELDRLVIAAMKLRADIVSIPHDPEKPDRSEASYRMAWARSYLKKAGLLENLPRGHWAISAKGRDAGTIDAYQLARDVFQALPKSTKSDEPKPPDEDDEELLTARVGDELGRQIGDYRVLPRCRLPGAPTAQTPQASWRGKMAALLDAKYRDLWERDLPRNMLYQLAIYALSQPKAATAAILFPTITADATAAVIEIRDPVRAGALGYVALRPVVLDELMEAVRVNGDPDRRVGMAQRLAFGTDSESVRSVWPAGSIVRVGKIERPA